MRGGLWVLCAEVQKSQNASPVLKVLPPPRHSVQTNKMFVDVRRGGKKKNCSSMFVVGCPCGRDLFVDVRRRTSTNKTDEHFVRRRTKNVRLHTMPRGGGGGGGGGGGESRGGINVVLWSTGWEGGGEAFVRGEKVCTKNFFDDVPEINYPIAIQNKRHLKSLFSYPS